MMLAVTQDEDGVIRDGVVVERAGGEVRVVISLASGQQAGVLLDAEQAVTLAGMLVSAALGGVDVVRTMMAVENLAKELKP